jgi:peptidyl-prolyl cis-trans isomerase A (cyclophilin A)
VVSGFVIQAGGFTAEGLKKQTSPPITFENTGLSNTRGTVAMARTADPDSATSQFYINLRDNTMLDPSPGNPGYSVIGTVIEGMEVVDQIGAVSTANRRITDPQTGQGGTLTDWPVEDVVITSATIR